MSKTREKTLQSQNWALKMFYMIIHAVFSGVAEYWNLQFLAKIRPKIAFYVSRWWREILDPSFWKSLYHISTILLVKNSKKWGQERTGIFGIHRNFLLNAFQKTTLTKKKKEVFICHGSSRSKCFLLQLLLLQQFPGTENYQRPFVSNHNAENEGSTFCFIV